MHTGCGADCQSATQQGTCVRPPSNSAFTVIHSNSLVFTVIHPFLKKNCGGLCSHTHSGAASVSVNFGPFRWFSAIFVFFLKKIYWRTAAGGASVFANATTRLADHFGRGWWKMAISNWRFQIQKRPMILTKLNQIRPDQTRHLRSKPRQGHTKNRPRKALGIKGR